MQSEIEKSSDQSVIENLYRDTGKIIILTCFTLSIFVIVSALSLGKKKDDYYSLLRQSYEGLAPEDY
jgi:hypothetical protein